jgi:RNA polymerase sigma factor for flagellar operon FliA
VSLETQLSDTVDMPAGESDNPEAQIAQEQFMDTLMASIESLPERERTVVSLYYVEEMNLKEIGAVLDVSESRISQILSSSVKKLRRFIDTEEG